MKFRAWRRRSARTSLGHALVAFPAAVPTAVIVSAIGIVVAVRLVVFVVVRDQVV